MPSNSGLIKLVQAGFALLCFLVTLSFNEFPLGDTAAAASQKKKGDDDETDEPMAQQPV